MSADWRLAWLPRTCAMLEDHIGHVEGAHLAMALDQRQDRRLLDYGPPQLPASLGADVGLIRFQGHAGAAEWRQAVHVAGRLHDLADTVRQEPCGFHRAIEKPLNVASADALLAAAHHVDDLQ